MVDYVPTLTRAVAALRPNTSAARRDLYDRARRMLVDRIHAGDPSLSGTNLSAEIAELEVAIQRVEAEALRLTTPPPQPQPRYEPHDTPVEGYEEYQDAPPLKDSRRPRHLIAGAVGALVILFAAVAAYALWPGIRSIARLGPPSASRVAEQPDAHLGYIYRRQPVYYRTNHPVGTIVVDKTQTFLYVVRPSVSALRYGIGVGPECITLSGLYQILRKEEWPGWKPPRQPSADVESERLKNPGGARALYLSKDTRIHGTNAPATIGQQSSEGCIRLANDDVIYLYDHTPLESRVVVLN
jgi:hypothetical protein